MKWPSFFLFLLLFVAVGFVYFKLVPVPMPEEAAVRALPQAAPTHVLALKKDDRITWFQIQNLEKNEMMTLVFESGRWQIKYPVTYEANQELADSLVREITATRREKMYVSDKDWEEFGLLKPLLKIGIETAKNPKRTYLYLGDSSPVEDMIFARWEGDQGYFLVAPHIKEAFENSLYAMREKKVFRTSFDRATEIIIHLESEDFAWRKEGSKWIWRQPETLMLFPVSSALSTDLLATLENLYIKDFVDPSRGQDAPGISDTGNKILIKTPEKQVTLWIGEDYSARDAFYAKLDGEESLLLVERSKIRGIYETISIAARGALVELKAA